MSPVLTGSVLDVMTIGIVRVAVFGSHAGTRTIRDNEVHLQTD